MLLQNKSFLACNGLIYLAGSPAVTGPIIRTEAGGYLNTYKNRYIGGASMSKVTGFPGGYGPGSAWLPAFTAGAIAASRGGISSVGDITDGNLAGGRNATASLTSSGRIVTPAIIGLGWIGASATRVLKGTGSLAAAITGARWGIATLAGSGNISDAGLNALAIMSILLASSGEIDFANLAGGLNATALLAGCGTISSATAEVLAWILATMSGSGDLTSSATGSIHASATLAGTGSSVSDIKAEAPLGASITAEGQIANAMPTAGAAIRATVAGSGLLEADVFALLNIVATLAGGGTLDLASDIIGARHASATIEGRADITAAINALASILATVHGEGSADLTIRALGNITATVTPFTELSPQGLAMAVWNSFYNEPGTMGAKVNAAASAGDPWTTELPADYPDGTAGDIVGKQIRLIKAITQALLAK